MSVVSLYYYIRFIRAMYIEAETEPEPVLLAPSLRVALVAAAVLVLYLGVFPQRLISFTQKAGMSPGLKTYSYADEAAKSNSAPPPGMPGQPPAAVPPPPR
jgi:formate hydrogenlyase subunit 3/multisubunit Na+/H+ antiporter MnhD subunit